ncbi:ATP-dependent DNA ligase [Nanoarchaeota archaeon NZ13-N]|nr:MAG: ATP-dependent DNA ligase [Nanoarchaeota archaeon NZ13-N]
MKFEELSQLFKKLEAISEKTGKVNVLASFIKNIPEDSLREALMLISGSIFYPWEERKLGVGEKLVMRAISIVTGISKEKIEELFVKLGDLGLVAEKLSSEKKQKTIFKKELTVKEVYETFREIGNLEGEGTIDKKVRLLSNLLLHASPLESRYIVRIALEDLKIGVGEGIIIESIASAYSLNPEDVEMLYAVYNDFGEIIYKIRKEGKTVIQNITPLLGKPLRVMLAIKAESITEAFDVVGRPAMIEAKYDGFRVQIHNINGRLELWTRRLENVTKQFPDVISFIEESMTLDKPFIIEAEIVGYDQKNKKYLPFQMISQRIKRKYDIERMVKEIPVEARVFDVVYFDGKSLMNVPFKDRRNLLEKIINPIEGKIQLSEGIITSSDKEAQDFFNEAIERGLEGVMFKNLNAPYHPGRRVGYMVKLKPTKETLDVVIVGAEWGEGKRGGWLTSFTIAVRDEETGELLEIGEIGSGFKEKKENPDDVTFEDMTNMLKNYIIRSEGKRVYISPKVVIEVIYDEIQKSPKYSSGFALRFPRFVRLRPDRSVEDIDTITRVMELYERQKG